MEYLSIVCAEAATSLERRLVVVCAWDVSGFLPLGPGDRLYDEGFKGLGGKPHPSCQRLYEARTVYVSIRRR